MSKRTIFPIKVNKEERKAIQRLARLLSDNGDRVPLAAAIRYAVEFTLEHEERRERLEKVKA